METNTILKTISSFSSRPFLYQEIKSRLTDGQINFLLEKGLMKKTKGSKLDGLRFTPLKTELTEKEFVVENNGDHLILIPADGVGNVFSLREGNYFYSIKLNQVLLQLGENSGFLNSTLSPSNYNEYCWKVGQKSLNGINLTLFYVETPNILDDLNVIAWIENQTECSGFSLIISDFSQSKVINEKSLRFVCIDWSTVKDNLTIPPESYLRKSLGFSLSDVISHFGNKYFVIESETKEIYFMGQKIKGVSPNNQAHSLLLELLNHPNNQLSYKSLAKVVGLSIKDNDIDQRLRSMKNTVIKKGMKKIIEEKVENISVDEFFPVKTQNKDKKMSITIEKNLIHFF